MTPDPSITGVCAMVNGQRICNTYLNKDLFTIGAIINTVLPFLYGLAAMILLFVLLWGGYDFILSGGEAEKVSAGRMKITAGIIGYVLLVISFLLVRIVAYVFGLSNGII